MTGVAYLDLIGLEIHDGVENPEGCAPELQFTLLGELVGRVRADAGAALVPGFVVPHHANEADLAVGPRARNVLARRVLVQAHSIDVPGGVVGVAVLDDLPAAAIVQAVDHMETFGPPRTA